MERSSNRKTTIYLYFITWISMWILFLGGVDAIQFIRWTEQGLQTLSYKETQKRKFCHRSIENNFFELWTTLVKLADFYIPNSTILHSVPSESFVNFFDHRNLNGSFAILSLSIKAFQIHWKLDRAFHRPIE